MDEESARLTEIYRVRRARLHQLELQDASMGRDAAPHIKIEISELRAALGLVEGAIASAASAEAVQELGPVGRYRSLHREIARVRQRSDEGLSSLGEQLESLRSDVRSYVRLFIVCMGALGIGLFVLGAILALALITGHM